MFLTHCSHTKWVIIVAPWFVLQPGGGMAASPVYRCIDEAGQVIFSQFLCSLGTGDALQVKVPKIGWQKAGSRPPLPQKRALQRALSAPPGRDRKPAAGRGDGCWKAQRRLQQIARRLRQGYRRGVGERLRRQRADQEAYVSRFCPDRSSSSR